MKKLVGYGFSLPSKPSLFNIGNFDLLGFLFDGRLKPYPTETYVIEGKEQGRSPVGRGVLSPTLTQMTNKLYGSILNIYCFYNTCNLCRLVSGRGHPDLRLFVMPTLIKRCVGKRTLRSSLC